jgi:hypothetical protein
MPATTLDVARQLGCRYFQLIYLIHTDRLQAPAKDSGGTYRWEDADIDRARAAVAEWRASRKVKTVPVE